MRSQHVAWLLLSLALPVAANDLAADLQTAHQTVHKSTTTTAANARPLAQAPLFNPLRSAPPAQFRLRADGGLLSLQGELQQPGVGLRSLEPAVRDTRSAWQFLRLHRGLLRLDDPGTELELSATDTDRLSGQRRLRFSQHYHGLEVWPGDMALYFDAAGVLRRVQGAYSPTPRRPLHLRPQADAAQVLAQIRATYPDAEVTQPQLIIYAAGQRPRLAWRAQVLLAPDRRLWHVTDALTGTTLAAFNQWHKAAVSGSGVDLLGQTRPLQLFSEDGRYFLADTSKAMFSLAGLSEPDMDHGSIMVFDAAHQFPDAYRDFIPELLASSRPGGGFLADGVSAAFNLSRSYDYFFQRLQRNSFDDRGSSLLGVVRVGQSYENAFWNGQALFFGDGLRFAAALDIVAHELTHGVIEHSAGLLYANQSGALNEALADIFGEMAQAYAEGAADWVSGGDALGLIGRSFSDPGAYGQPARMSEFITLPNTEAGDNGGVHINSGIINHAFYLLAAGLPEALGVAQAEQIAYRALTQYLLRNAQFIDARLAFVSAARDLYGESAVAVVEQAFDAVEIFATDPATPPPSSFEPVSDAPDAALVACLTTTGRVHVCRHDPAQDGTGLVVLSRSETAPQRIAVQGDGSVAAFVSAQRDLCLLEVQSGAESCLGRRDVHSVAIAPNGERYALVMLDADGFVDNQILLIDLPTGDSRTYPLYAPAADAGQPVNTLLSVDSLAFSSDGSTLIFDAYNLLRSADGGGSGVWTIYALDLTSGRVDMLINPAPGYDIGFPSLAKTSDNFMAFDVYAQASGELEIRTLNLSSNEERLVYRQRADYSIPSYNGDDTQLGFMLPDLNSPLGYRVVVQQLGNDRQSPQGEPQTWLTHAAYPTLYRPGEFIGNTPVAAYFDLITGIMRVFVDLPRADGTIAPALADLRLLSRDESGFLFVLLDYVWLEEAPALRSTFYVDWSVWVPRAVLTDAQGNSAYWQLALRKRALPGGAIGYFLAHEGIQAIP